MKLAEPIYPMAWHGMALNLPLITAYHMNYGMKYRVPDCGILKTFPFKMEYECR